MKKLFTFFSLLLCISILAQAAPGDVYKWYVEGRTQHQTLNGEKLSQNFFTLGEKQNLNANYPGTYDGIVCERGLKMESATSVSFTTTDVTNIIVVQSLNKNADKTIKFDGEAITGGVDNTADKARVFTLTNVAAGEHAITRGSGESGIFYVSVTYPESTSTLPAAPISWSVDKVTYKVREALPAELPVLTNTENLPLTFTSSNDAIAAVAEDGTVTLSNEVAGTAIVTAAFAGSETYDATNVSFTVEVLSNKVDANVADPNLVEGQIAVDNIWKASAELPADGTIYEDANVTITNPFLAKVSSIKKNYLGQEFGNSIQVRSKAAPSADAPAGTDNGGSTTLVITPKVDMTLVVYGRRQAVEQRQEEIDDVENNIITVNHYWGATPNDGKSLKFIDQADPATLLDQEIILGTWNDPNNTDYLFVASVVNLEAGKTYTGFALGTTYSVNGIGYKLPVTLADAELSFEAADYTTILGEEFNAPVLNNPNGLAVTYTSDNTDVATVDAATGAVTVIAAGKAVISASSEATDTYLPGNATYTLTVIDPNFVERTTTWVEGNGKVYILESNGFIVTREDNTEENPENKQIQNGNALKAEDGSSHTTFKFNNVRHTITAPEGKLITKITFHAYVNADADETPDFIAHVGREDYEAGENTTVNAYKVKNELGTILTFDVNALNAVDFYGSGSQLCAALEVETIDQIHAPANPVVWYKGQPTDVQHGSECSVDTQDETTISIIAEEGMQVYMRFIETTPAEESSKAPADGDDSALTVNGHEYQLHNAETGFMPRVSGELRYFARDPKKNVNGALHVVKLGVTTGIEDITVNPDTDATSDAPVYNIYGQRVDDTYRGIVISNGRKYIRK